MGHDQEKLIFTIIFLPFFLISIMLHEIAHGYIAYLQGDPTAKYAGRFSLNPIDHLDLMGTACFIITSLMGVGFGWAKPVPINPILFKNYRGGIIKVSLAGVATNFILMIIGFLALKLLVMTGVINPFSNDQLQFYITRIIITFMLLNMILVVFNLIPVPPLDGSKVLMMMLPREQAIALARLEPFGMLIIFALLASGALGIVFSFASNLLGTAMHLFIFS